MDTEYKQNLCRKLDTLNRLEREGYKPYVTRKKRYLDLLALVVLTATCIVYVATIPSYTLYQRQDNEYYCQLWHAGSPVIGATLKQMLDVCGKPSI